MKLYTTYLTRLLLLAAGMLAAFIGWLIYAGWIADVPPEASMNARKAALFLILLFLLCLRSKPKTINAKIKNPYGN